MNETKFTANLRDYVESNNGGSIKLGASMFLAKGTPDTIYFFDGHTFFLESKVWPNKPTRLQLYKVSMIRKWGGFAWAVTLKDGIIELEDLKFESVDLVFKHISKLIKEKRV